MSDIITLKTNIPTGSGLKIVSENFKVLEVEAFSFHVKGKILKGYDTYEESYLNLIRFLQSPNISLYNQNIAKILETLFRDGRTEVSFYIIPRSISKGILDLDNNNEYEADLVADIFKPAYLQSKLS